MTFRITDIVFSPHRKTFNDEGKVLFIQSLWRPVVHVSHVWKFMAQGGYHIRWSITFVWAEYGNVDIQHVTEIWFIVIPCPFQFFLRVLIKGIVIPHCILIETGDQKPDFAIGIDITFIAEDSPDDLILILKARSYFLQFLHIYREPVILAEKCVFCFINACGINEVRILILGINGNVIPAGWDTLIGDTMHALPGEYHRL